jgi:aspartate/methionine/tyrosine aminotransferase
MSRSQALLAANTPIVREFLRSRPELDWIEPDGSTVVFPRLRVAADSNIFAQRLLEERDTAIVPGRFFEAPEHFRVGLGGATPPLRAGLAAVGAALDAGAW